MQGLCAAFGTCLIAALWQIATRAGLSGNGATDPLDLALFRYGVPALVLLPLWARLRFWPRGVPRLALVGMLAGAGLPFGLLAMAGAQFAPVAHMGVMLPGLSPLFIALTSALVLHERFSAGRLLGLVLLLLGAGLVGAETLRAAVTGASAAGAWRGDLLFLCAAFAWGIYAVAFRRSGMSAWQAAAFINGWSLVALVALRVALGKGISPNGTSQTLLVQFLAQGILSGLIGGWLFGVAVSAIGPSRAAAIGALVPVLVALGGALVLGEVPSLAVAAGGLIVALGVVLSTGALATRPLPPSAKTG